MTEAIAVAIPLLNPNEPEAVITDLPVVPGDEVAAGDVLATIETTKSSADLLAEQDGYAVGVRAKVGDAVAAGDILLWIAQSPDWEAPPEPEEPAETSKEGLRITQPARQLAEEQRVDLQVLPEGPLITAEWLRDWLAGQEEQGPIDERALIVYGGGGHGKAVIELVRLLGSHDIVGLVDDGLRAGDKVLDVEVLGGGDRLRGLRAEGVGLAANAVGGIGDINSRIGVFRRLGWAGFRCPSLAHPTAVVEESASLAEGIQVFPHAYVGSAVEVGFGSIVNTAAVVSHDCRLGENVNIAPGALLAGAVTVGEGSLIGMGVTVNLDVDIGARARIGNSAVVKRDVPAGAVVPAGSVWPEPGRREEAHGR